MAAYLVNHILGGGSFTSRLYDQVREKRGLVYGVSSYLLNLRHSPLFMVSTQTSASRVVPRLRSRSGRAMIRVPELIVASNIPTLVHESAHHL